MSLFHLLLLSLKGGEHTTSVRETIHYQWKNIKGILDGENKPWIKMTLKRLTGLKNKNKKISYLLLLLISSVLSLLTLSLKLQMVQGRPRKKSFLCGHSCFSSSSNSSWRYIPPVFMPRSLSHSLILRCAEKIWRLSTLLVLSFKTVCQSSLAIITKIYSVLFFLSLYDYSKRCAWNKTNCTVLKCI